MVCPVPVNPLLTHAKHGGKYAITVLHDDAFIINTDTCSSVALEPTYFDKTADYPTGCPDNKYYLCPHRTAPAQWMRTARSSW